MTTKDKSIWILIVFLLAGLVVGGLIGKLAEGVPSLWWLCYENQFGFSEPFGLGFTVLKITFELVFKINVAGIIGMILALFIYKKLK